MESADECDVARPAAGIPGKLHRALDRLSPRIGEEDLRRRSGENLGLEPLCQLDLGLVIEVSARHVKELLRLFLDGGDDTRMGMSCGHDGNAGREVQEAIAV